MSNYKDIVGTAVRNNAGNLPAPETGQVWFDSTNLDFKYQQPNKTSAASWSTGDPMNTARAYNFGTAGVKTAALNFGGNEPPGSVTAKTELWDGATWTEVADLNDARGEIGGCGTQTSALAAGGNSPNPTANTEEWNGSAWTEVSGNLNTARKSLAAAGTRESAVVFGGFGPPYYANTEVWNGTSFSENADLNNARNQLGGAGSSSTSA